ncbi:MAG: hypothetical protein COZ86_02365 [Candidatus Moranbacteria bacterium CG_4_8_14_3_um_filter_41_13]|nr:MAG: hypothetical protein AUK58_00800 [Candidatus Moranbacteria bacterium CG2_30_41_165]PIV86427.1 MAG: hypothetical protein COW50_01470 [Candidatus Moranbacteria bacterium CG17_big_fil_post_rev_8_21_14_2_50_41_107]PIW94192.1 MAG: hypothetical protein COZ86_02365 [Candidatus Moranbacteria bacterium CG_4_8_14_3_um_filter_41_13]
MEKVEEEIKQKNVDMEPEEKKSSHTKRNIFLFIIFILLFGGIYILWLFLQSPAIGVIRTSSLPKEEAFDTGTETKQFVGTSFSFSYPGRYKERAHTLPEAGPVEESIFLSATDVEGKKITLTLEKRDADTLDASPSFQMRQNDKKTYTKSSFKWDGLDRVLFIKDSQVFEKILFLQRKNLFLIISVSSPFSLDTLSQDLEDILTNLKWEKK